MKWNKWLENWDMTSLKIKAPFLEMDWKPSEPDKKAAWELYIELLTRITTQPIGENDGDEKAALESVYSLFPTTRSIIKENGRDCIEFTKLAIVVLNQSKALTPVATQGRGFACADSSVPNPSYAPLAKRSSANRSALA